MVRGGAVALAAFLAVAGCAASRPSPADRVPRVLVFSGTYGFRHSSISTSHRVVRDLARSTGAFSVTVTEDPKAFTSDRLRRTDVIVFANTTGETPFTPAQKRMIVRFWESGGGFIGIHSAADTNYKWPEYQELVGAAFTSHPHSGNLTGGLADQATVVVEDGAHAITRPWRGKASFPLTEEYYKWRADPRGTQDVRVLLSLDESTVYPWVQATDPYPHRQPVEWTKSFRGRNRVWYTNLGHYEATYERTDWQQHFVAAVRWVARPKVGS